MADLHACLYITLSLQMILIQDKILSSLLKKTFPLNFPAYKSLCHSPYNADLKLWNSFTHLFP